MAGYVRQSVANIQATEPITAAPLNNEFNQLQSAFHASTGHTHDGTVGNGPLISLTTGTTGTLPLAQGGTAATTAAAARTSLFGVSTTVDNTVARYDGTSGALQSSGVVIGDTNAVSGIVGLTVTGGGSLTGTWTSLGTVTTMDLNGGTIDGTVIGGSFAAAGTFTALNSTSGTATAKTITTATINGGTINNTSIGATTRSTALVTTLGANGLITGSAGLTISAGVTTIAGPMITSGLTLFSGSEVNTATTSGTSHQVTIDANVTKIEMIFNGVSNISTDTIYVRLGDSGGIESTGYTSWYMSINDNVNFGFADSTGIRVPSSLAATVIYGTIIFNKIPSTNTWVFTVNLADTSGDYIHLLGSGAKTTSGAMDRIVLTTFNGVSAFDGGSFVLRYS
jgi:hypothetical protein